MIKIELIFSKYFSAFRCNTKLISCLRALPCKQRFHSCKAFSVYDVARVASLSRSWFVYTPWETSAASRLWFPLSMLFRQQKILENLWLIGFKTGFQQLNNSRALISDRFAVQTDARMRLFPATHVSTKRSEQRTFIALHCSIIKSFNSLSVHGVILFCKWRCLRKFSNRS